MKAGFFSLLRGKERILTNMANLGLCGGVVTRVCSVLLGFNGVLQGRCLANFNVA